MLKISSGERDKGEFEVKLFNKNDCLPHGFKWYRKKTVVPMVKMKEAFKCESREGILEGKPGDFLAEDGHGGFYPVSAEFHEKNYVEVKEDEDQP